MADFFSDTTTAAKTLGRLERPWYRELNRYHWFVLIVAALGWMFDCLDQQLFTLARVPAMNDLLRGTGLDPNAYGGYATAIFLMGWASGGIIFGMLGDRIGRAKTMLITILLYSLCTGLSALSTSFEMFAAFRFITGLGVGGEFAVGVSLVAEVMPELARPYALGLLQALSAFGNISSALISMAFGHLEREGVLGQVELFHIKMTAWRGMFLVGALPALLAVAIRFGLKEPEKWQAAVRTDGKRKLGSFGELLGNPHYRRRAIGGMLLACSGVIALWGIGFFSADLTRSVFRLHYYGEARDGGAAKDDQQFVAALIADPQYIKKLPEELKSAYLISPVVQAERASASDAQALFDAAKSLAKDKKEITKESVLAWLDQEDAERHRTAQSAADRARRAAYLDATPLSTAEFGALTDKIVERGKDIDFRLNVWSSIGLMLMNVGGFFGVYSFSFVSQTIGRKPTFAICFITAMLSTALVFYQISPATVTIAGIPMFRDVLWMMPLMGFFQLSIFGGYAIYFPELFPTRLRSTGTSFCYNVGRFLAATGPYTLGVLASQVYQHTAEPLRWSGLTMCGIFLLGLAVLPFLPETKGQPLPD